MLKFLPQLAVAGIAIVAIMIINTSGVQASSAEQTLPISVLAQSRTNYGVDSGLATVPAVSMDIIQDKIKDEALGSLLYPIVAYPPVDLKTKPNATSLNNQVSTSGISSPSDTTATTLTTCLPSDVSCSGGNNSANGNGNGQGNGNGNGQGNGNGKGNGQGNGNGKGNGNGNGNGQGNGQGNGNGKGNGQGNGKGKAKGKT